MKHVLGYGVLIVALAAALVWGCKRVACAPGKGPVALVSPRDGDDTAGNFLVDLMEKGRKKPPQREVTDHATDYKGFNKTFIWKLDEPFTIAFDAGAVPCSGTTKEDGTGSGPYILASPPTSTEPKYTATCTLATLPSANVTLTANGVTYSGFSYHVILNPPFVNHAVGPKGPPVTTCDGCFLELD